MVLRLCRFVSDWDTAGALQWLSQVQSNSDGILQFCRVTTGSSALSCIRLLHTALQLSAHVPVPQAPVAVGTFVCVALAVGTFMCVALTLFTWCCP